jgi:hypothetical protein
VWAELIGVAGSELTGRANVFVVPTTDPRKTNALPTSVVRYSERWATSKHDPWFSDTELQTVRARLERTSSGVIVRHHSRSLHRPLRPRPPLPTSSLSLFSFPAPPLCRSARLCLPPLSLLCRHASLQCRGRTPRRARRKPRFGGGGLPAATLEGGFRHV